MPVDPRAAKARLDALKKRRRDARTRLAEIRKKLEQAESDGDRAAAETLLAEGTEVDAEIKTTSALIERELGQLSGQAETFGQTLRTNVEAQDTLRQLANSSAPLREYVAIGDFLSADEFVGWLNRHAAPVTIPGDPATDLPGQFIGISDEPSPPRTLLGVFGAVPVAGRTVSFLQRNGLPASGLAGVQSEPGAIKHEAALTYTPADEDVATVATWIKVLKDDLDDFDQLASDITQALGYGIRTEVERLMITAITSASVLDPDVSAGTNTPDKLLLARGALAATGALPNFAAVNPLDATAAWLEREGTDGAYLAGSPWNRLPPLVESVALAQNDALIGDSNGAKIGVRAGVSIAVGTESDDMVRNVRTILVETRVVPIVRSPGSFADVDLTATP